MTYKTKEELEQLIVMHKEALESSRHSVTVDTQDLEIAIKDLEDLNKSELTNEMYNKQNKNKMKLTKETLINSIQDYRKQIEESKQTTTLLIEESNQTTTLLTDKLNEHENALSNINKPIISETVHGLIIEIITDTIDDVQFDADDFDYDMKMGYNNTVELDEITLKEKSSLIDDIMNGINNQFYVTEDLAEVIIDNDEHSVMGSFDENGDAE
tara:strand:+ start:5201 stop:5839 length:639 start_codon:yes stop_codon:yes gene_type:complete